MSKRMLLALSVLSSACGAPDVVDAAAVVVASSTETPNQQEAPVVELTDSQAPASQTPAEPTQTELPGVRVEDGPVSIIPSSAVTTENIDKLAEDAVAALKQTVSDAINQIELHVEQGVEDVLVKEGHSFIDFLTKHFNSFVEYLKNGWKYMVYNSVGGATRHIVASAATRSIVLDLSSLQVVDAHAAQCLENMAAAKAVILAAAEARSPQIKTATEACLAQYEAWFTGTSRAFVGDENTSLMLQALGLSKVSCRSFNLQNLHNFSKLGGEALHRGLFFAVSPSESSGLLTRSADVAEAATLEDESVVADNASATDASSDDHAVSNEELKEEIDELISEVQALQEQADEMEEALIEELIIEEAVAEELARQADAQADDQSASQAAEAQLDDQSASQAADAQSTDAQDADQADDQSASQADDVQPADNEVVVA